jgi:hypothetical protein
MFMWHIYAPASSQRSVYNSCNQLVCARSRAHRSVALLTGLLTNDLFMYHFSYSMAALVGATAERSNINMQEENT